MSALMNHRQCIEMDCIGRGNVIGLRKAINNAAMVRRGYRGSSTALRATPEQVDQLELLVTQHRPVAEGLLHTTGLKVLRNPRYAKRWSPEQAAVIRDAVRFRLLGFDRIQNGRNCVPVFRVETQDGRGFAFRNIPWQAEGRGPEVVPERPLLG